MTHYGWNTVGAESEDGFAGRFRTRAGALKAGRKAVGPGVVLYTARLEYVDLAAGVALHLNFEDALDFAADDENMVIEHPITIDDALMAGVEAAIRRVLRAHREDLNAWRAEDVQKHEPEATR